MANGLLSNILGFDPTGLQQQRLKQFLAPVQQAQNPYERIGAALGSIGGSMLFGMEDPQLAKVAQTQSIYNEVMKGFNPDKPTETWATLAKAYAEAGLAGPAQLAQQELTKSLAQDKQLSLREREVTASEKRTEADIESQKETAKYRNTQLKLELDREARLGRYTDAQIKELNDRVSKGDKKIVSGKGENMETIFYEVDERNGTVKPIVPLGSGAAAPAGAGKTPAQLAAEELKRRSGGAAPARGREFNSGDTSMGMGF